MSMSVKTEYSGLEIAVIGMSGRFPGAENLTDFWENLVQGVESISIFDDAELIAAGVDSESLLKSNYVKAKGVFPNLEYFDANFFNYTPKDAATLDPQVRALHEEVYHALEDAGYASESYKGNIGLFLGATNNFAWEAHTLKTTLDSKGHNFATIQLNDKDYAATRIAYSLNLKGPSVMVHSACSTSLYAIDLACKYILTGGCQIAVAGGSGITLPNKNGYLYETGMINSPTGQCRAFDENAQGTVEGNGAGVVVLKSLESAINDRDNIYAIIKGSFSNNDGNRKVGYMAPSVEGQAEVIRKALLMADATPKSISYIETHGTGTLLGDPIEIEGLKKAFQFESGHTCALGSLKPNIGHLDVAAGIASFIKLTISMYNETIPKSINFDKLNPAIDIASSPFRIVTETEQWKREKMPNDQETFAPLRAGVSAFGIGGTNVHIIMEERPKLTGSRLGREWKIFSLSANSRDALNHMKAQYIELFQQEKHIINDNDMVWSIHTGRKALEYRFSMAFNNKKTILDRLINDCEGIDNEPHGGTNIIKNPKVFFMFPGQGSQYVGMAKRLYETEPIFQKEVEKCIQFAEAQGCADLRRILLNPRDEDRELIKETKLAQIALFVIEYALAQLLTAWGVKPAGFIGHSLGELTAACLSGVFTLEEGIYLILERGRLMQSMPKGSMLSINASGNEIKSFLTDKICIAAMNSSQQCTVSGAEADIEEFKNVCLEKGIQFRQLQTSHAFHSELMSGMLESFESVCGNIKLSAPKVPYISNLTGEWIDGESAKSAAYYAEQVKNCVQFNKGIEGILENENAVLIEVGPGNTLMTLARQNIKKKLISGVCTIPHAKDLTDGAGFLAENIGKLWTIGVDLDWPAYYKGQLRNRIKLPLYPFEKIKFPIAIDGFRRMLEGSKGVSIDTDQQDSTHESQTINENPTLTIGRFSWEESFVPKEETVGIKRACLVIKESGSAFDHILNYLTHWRLYPVIESENYEFNGTLGAQIQHANYLHIYCLIQDLEERALLPDTIMIMPSSMDRMIESLKVWSYVLSQTFTGDKPQILLISHLINESEILKLSLLAYAIANENKDLSIHIINSDMYLNGKDIGENWAKMIKSEALNNTYAVSVANYIKNTRYVLEVHNFSDISETEKQYYNDKKTLFVVKADQLQVGLKQVFGKNITRKIRVLPYELNEVSFDKRWMQTVAKELDIVKDSYLLDHSLEGGLEADTLLDKYTTRLAYDCINKYFHLEKGKRFNIYELSEKIMDAELYSQYMNYIMYILCEDQIINGIEADCYDVKKNTDELQSANEIRLEVESKAPFLKDYLDYIENSMYQIEQKLSKHMELHVGEDFIQQENNRQQLEGVIHPNSGFKFIKEMVGYLIPKLTSIKDNLRILEVSEGNDTLLEQIMPLLKGLDVEYYYSNKDESCLQAMKQCAIENAVDSIYLGELNISNALQLSEMDNESFDLIFVYDLAHTANSIQTTLLGLKKLLKRGGILCLSERITVSRHQHLVCGIEEDWWTYDKAERNIMPFIPLKRWKEILKKAGLQCVSAYPTQNDKENALSWGLLVGQNPYDEKQNLYGNKDNKDIEIIQPIKVEEIDQLAATIETNIKNISDIDRVVLWDCLENKNLKFYGITNEKHRHIKNAYQINFAAELISSELGKECFIVSAIALERKGHVQTAGWMSVHSLVNMQPNINRIYLPLLDNETEKDITSIFEAMRKTEMRQLVLDAQNYSLFNLDNRQRLSKNEHQCDEESLEMMLLKLWQKLLEVDGITLDSNFFEIGGDSFKIVQLTGELEKVGYKVFMNEFYNYQTIRSLSQYLKDQVITDTQIITKEDQFFEALQVECRFIVSEGEENYNILFVGNGEDLEAARKKLKSKSIVKDILPHYILPMSYLQQLPENLKTEDLVHAGILCSSEKEILGDFIKRINKQQEKYNKSILSQPIISKYGLSNLQKMHFRGEVRLQLYLIEFEEIVDTDLLQQAFCDVVGSHGLMRSCLEKHFFAMRWNEYAPPQQVEFPNLDLSKLTAEAQKRVINKIIDYEWNSDFKIVGVPMYHLVLLKLNEHRYNILFQFDHSIFDVSSGQKLRSDLIKRYSELKNGVRRAMHVSSNYKDYLRQVYKGPMGVDADELLEMFEMQELNHQTKVLEEQISMMNKGPIQHSRCSIDLEELRFDNSETDESFILTIHIYVLLIAKLLNVDAVPFHLLFSNRSYQNSSYADVIGMVLDAAPFLLHVDRKNPEKMAMEIKKKLDYINKHNISFLNLVWNFRSLLKWGKVMGSALKTKSAFLRSVCLLNYAGKAEGEYTKVWDYSLEQLWKEDQSKLDYGDIYGLAKIHNNQLDFVVLSRIDPNKITETIEEEIAYFRNRVLEKKNRKGNTI